MTFVNVYTRKYYLSQLVIFTKLLVLIKEKAVSIGLINKLLQELRIEKEWWRTIIKYWEFLKMLQ